jgi:dihydrofolate reductase
MKTILIFVSSLDGKITRWGNPFIRSWSSKSDQEHFDAIWKDTHVIIMGSGTYDPDPVKPLSHHLFIVLTRQPERYKSQEVPGRLEFTDVPPLLLIKRFIKEDKVLIVGGAKIAALFLKAQLIDELWLTIEPRIFGMGPNFVNDEKLDLELKLLSCEQANEQGTLILKYQVLKAGEKLNGELSE